MKEEKFKVIKFIRELIIYLDTLLDNFPKKDIELKNRLRKNSYDILEIAYEANMTMSKEKKKDLLEKSLSKIKVLDFLINICYDKEIINSNKYLIFGNKIDDITKYLIGWTKSL